MKTQGIHSPSSDHSADVAVLEQPRGLVVRILTGITVRNAAAILGQGLQQPLTFYGKSDDRPRELVITRVTPTPVIGYLLLPPDAPAAGSPPGPKPSTP